MEPVKITSLELENVKRVRAASIVPTKDGLTVIGGRNGQGKTSILDAIAWALGGNKMKPDNPNRAGGATPAKLHVELSNGITVERRGKNGTLYVTDTTGKKGTQKLLDEFLSALALDLPRFLGGTDKDRTNALLQTLGIDEQLASIDGQIRSTYQRRQMVGQDAKVKRAYASKLPKYDDAPAAPVSVADLIQQQQAILARNGENQRKRDDEKRIERQLGDVQRSAENLDQRIKSTQEQLARYIEEENRRIAQMQSEYMDMCDKERAMADDLEAAKKTAEQLVDESTAEIEQSIANIETINNHVRDNERRAEAEQAATAVEQEYRDLSASIESLREQRVGLLDGAPLPLEGLSIDEENRLTYQGQTWSDMSGAEQLRVATAIVRATKPDCGFVLVDKLEQFDTQQLSEFAQWAQVEGLQVIGTRVSTGDECSIIIEDGVIDDAPVVAEKTSKVVAEPAPTAGWGSFGSWGGNQ